MPAAALPCVVVGAAALCEQVPNGRNTNFKCTACQPTLGKKPDLLSGKNSRLSQMSKRELAHILP